MHDTDSARVERGSLIEIDSTFLPVGQMRQICRVTDVGESAISGEVDLGLEHWVYPHHFPGDPIFPGTLIIEAAGQLVALCAWSRGKRGRPRLVRASAKFHHPVEPQDARMRLCAEVRGKRNLSFAKISAWTHEVQVATLEVVLAVLP